jgi:hypothetical protein
MTKDHRPETKDETRAAHMFLRLALAGAALLFAAPVSAQYPVKPIGRFVADVRVAFPKFKDLPSVNDAIGVTEDDTPGRGLGLVFGVHVYPLRMGPVTLGLGGELLVSRGRKTIETETSSGTTTAGPTVESRLSSISPQISLNFGNRQGWSYLSGGIGGAVWTTEVETGSSASDAPRVKAINYGGGARWFAKPHLAFTFDLRWYAVDPQLASGTRSAYPRTTMSVISVGASFR